MKLIILFITLVILIVIASCDLPMSAGPQPTQLINTNYAPGLNILGVIRNDGESLSTSFVYVERSFREEEWDDIDEVIYDAEVIVERINDSHIYSFTNEIEEDFQSEIYRSDSLFALAGEEYLISVTAPNLPTLSANTIIPQQPAILENSLSIASTRATFEILVTNDTWMYEIYLIYSDSSVISKRYLSSTHDNIDVSIDYEAEKGRPVQMRIFGFDKNLADYLSVNIVLKPQSYQKPFSTVNNGYGSFGSLSQSTFDFTQD